MARRSLYLDGVKELMVKRVLIAVAAIATLAAAPADRTRFVYDQRLPLENQQLLEESLTQVIEQQFPDGTRATVVFKVRVIEPELPHTMLRAEADQNDASERSR